MKHGWGRAISYQLSAISIRTVILLLVFALAGCSGAGRDVDPWTDLRNLKESSGRVIRVPNGETFLLNVEIRCLIDGRIKDLARVRYIGIDTPESNEPFYGSVKELNKSLVYGKGVKLVFDEEKVDSYDRLLAYVYVGDLFVNAEIVRRGYARAETVEPNTGHEKLFRKLEKEAREKKIGIWSIPEPKVVSKEPEQVETPTKEKFRFVASKSSEVFHVPSCRWVEKITSPKEYFSTYKEAEESGRRPCKVCRPRGE